MSQSYIKLNPKQCNSLLEAIVDCEPELYEMIKNCAQIYKKDPDLYDIQYINQQIKEENELGLPFNHPTTIMIIPKVKNIILLDFPKLPL